MYFINMSFLNIFTYFLNYYENSLNVQCFKFQTSLKEHDWFEYAVQKDKFCRYVLECKQCTFFLTLHVTIYSNLILPHRRSWKHKNRALSLQRALICCKLSKLFKQWEIYHVQFRSKWNIYPPPLYFFPKNPGMDLLWTFLIYSSHFF